MVTDVDLGCVVIDAGWVGVVTNADLAGVGMETDLGGVVLGVADVVADTVLSTLFGFFPLRWVSFLAIRNVPTSGLPLPPGTDKWVETGGVERSL